MDKGTRGEATVHVDAPPDAVYAVVSDDGRFRIEGVPNGRWIADAYAPGYLSPGGVELEVFVVDDHVDIAQLAELAKLAG